MKTLILLAALASIVIAGPTHLGKDTFNEHPRDIIGHTNLKTVVRERKSPIQDLPSELVLEGQDATLSHDGRSSSALKNSGLRKPIIVKKKFGYHIYRDSDEELAQAEPRENCRRQFRFKLCDEGSEQIINGLRNTEDIDETDVEQSLKMAKEAVEILQRDLEKIERNTKLSQRTFVTDTLNDKYSKEVRESVPEITNDDEDSNHWKSKSASDLAITSAEERKMAEWKEAIENIQKNVEIVKNIEDSFRTPEHLITEDTDENKTKTITPIKTLGDHNVDTLKKGDILEQPRDTLQKNVEDDMETYATENKEIKSILRSDSLKIEKLESRETIDNMRHANDDLNIKHIDNDEAVTKAHGKSADMLKLSTHEGNIMTDIDNPHLSTLIEKSWSDKERNAVLENKDTEKAKIINEIDTKKPVTSDIHAKAAIDVVKDEELKLSKNLKDITDAEVAESRHAEKSNVVMLTKEKSANLLDVSDKKDIIDLNDKNSLSQPDNIERAAESEIKNISGALKESAGHLTTKSIPKKDHQDTPKLREVEDNGDLDILSSNIVEARNVENELNEKITLDIKHNDNKKEKSAELGSDEKIHNAMNLGTDRDNTLFMKASEIVNEKLHGDDIKHPKMLENLDHSQHHHTLDINKERHTEEATKIKEITGVSDKIHSHSPKYTNIDPEKTEFSNVPLMKMSEMDYYNGYDNQHSGQLVRDKNIDYHLSTHLKDGVSNWDHMKYQQGFHSEPYLNSWPHDRFRSDMTMEPHHHQHQHHLGHVHLEEDPHMMPAGGHGPNVFMGNEHDLFSGPIIPENGRASEWDSAMQPSLHMNMRESLDKNGMPWGTHRHAYSGLVSSVPVSVPTTSGSGAVGVFPNSNGGCGIPLLLSCSPSVVSGSLAKSHSLGYNGPAFRSGDDLRFYTKRDAQTLQDLSVSKQKVLH